MALYEHVRLADGDLADRFDARVEAEAVHGKLRPTVVGDGKDYSSSSPASSSFG